MNPNINVDTIIQKFPKWLDYTPSILETNSII